MVHFSALAGTKDFEGDRQLVLERARQDLATLQDGGVDAVMFENNFDVPKYATMLPETSAHFRELLETLVPETRVPWGVCALWNDYAFGFDVCAKLGGSMVRVPVFVDDVETVYGAFLAQPEAVLAARQAAGAEHVKLYADVHVKHAKMIHPRPFAESVRDAVKHGADGIIVTGQWTGDPPSVEQCAEAKREAGPDVAILTGSGMTAENILSFAPDLDATIVGTAFKQGSVNTTSRQGPNIVGPELRYDVKKINDFVRAVRPKNT